MPDAPRNLASESQMDAKARRRANQHKTDKARRERRRAQGLCTKCGRPSGGKSRCADCGAKDNAATRRRLKAVYDRRAASGACPRCGEPSKGRHRHCAKCRAKVAAGVQSRVAPLIAARRAAGLCTKCGEQPAPPGYIQCEDCRVRFAEYQRRRNLRNRPPKPPSRFYRAWHRDEWGKPRYLFSTISESDCEARILQRAQGGDILRYVISEHPLSKRKPGEHIAPAQAVAEWGDDE